MIFDHFLIFLKNIIFFLNCKNKNFKIMFYYFFLLLTRVIFLSEVKNTPNFHIFIVLKGTLSFYFQTHILGVFHYFSHHGHAPIFFAPLLLSVQYLNLTIRCVSWEQLMSVMKHFAMSVCMSVCA